MTIDDPVTALVVLRPPSGRLTAASATAEHAAANAPSAAAIERVTDHFRALGCEVGPVVGVSFAVTMPGKRAAELLDDSESGIQPSSLPRRVRLAISAIVRNDPIDFGPGNFA
jgi:hypothetical protein